MDTNEAITQPRNKMSFASTHVFLLTPFPCFLSRCTLIVILLLATSFLETSPARTRQPSRNQFWVINDPRVEHHPPTEAS